MKSISIILPTLNERENILPLIHAIRRELNRHPHEILVIDDDSSDGTAQTVIDAGIPDVAVIVRTDDHGYAQSIRRGIEEARGDVLVLMDSDFNHDPGEIPMMLRALPDYDCVSGSRFLAEGRMIPAWRGVCSRMFNDFVCLLTGSRLTDNIYGFFVLERKALLQCSFDDIFFGFGDYGMRLLFCLQRNKARILEVPSMCRERLAGRGNRRFVQTGFIYIRETIKLARKGRIQ